MIARIKPAVGYIRMSTDKQEDSPEQQRAEIGKPAQRDGYHHVGPGGELLPASRSSAQNANPATIGRPQRP
ncbi:MAG: recombinase family protein [Pirellulales bacterium]